MTLTQPEFIQLPRASAHEIRAEVSAGLLAASAHAAPKYFYDALGSRLFAAICELPEYYLARAEASIFDAHLGEIAASAGTGGTLIDLGAGNCAKAARLFTALRPAHYVPVDISVDFLRHAVGDLQQRFPHIRMTGVGTDFSRELELPRGIPRERRLFFYPGSSIGNFAPDQALAFFRRLRTACADDGALLLGVDLVKAPDTLHRAYNDALGVTASFNLNLLLHLNRLLGADFDIAQWRHVSFFDAAHSRIEMHLEARHAVHVRWDGGERRFREGERIHTENSYKYSPEGFTGLLEQGGFRVTGSWRDAGGSFMVCHAIAA